MLFLVVSETAVSGVSVREEGAEQFPIYYVSRSLLLAEKRYSPMERLVLALVMASNKLMPYFEAHTIVVRTNLPMKNVMSRPEFTGRMEKWSIHLSGYDLRYEPGTVIKSQALADFVVDFSSPVAVETEHEVAYFGEKGTWTLHTERETNTKGVGLGVILKSP